jgi:hypothetical protein
MKTNSVTTSGSPVTNQRLAACPRPQNITKPAIPRFAKRTFLRGKHSCGGTGRPIAGVYTLWIFQDGHSDTDIFHIRNAFHPRLSDVSRNFSLTQCIALLRSASNPRPPRRQNFRRKYLQPPTLTTNHQPLPSHHTALKNTRVYKETHPFPALSLRRAQDQFYSAS